MTRTDTTASTPLPARIDAVLAQEWPAARQDAPAGLAWDRRTSPPIPDAWPVTATTRITCYAYAAAQDPERLRDGEHVAVPWGATDYEAGSPDTLRFLRIGARLRELGTQGVKPLTRAEVDGAMTDADLHRALAALATADDAALASRTLDAYRRWQRLNGVVAAPILARHPAFAAALAQR